MASMMSGLSSGHRSNFACYCPCETVGRLVNSTLTDGYKLHFFISNFFTFVFYGEEWLGKMRNLVCEYRFSPNRFI